MVKKRVALTYGFVLLVYAFAMLQFVRYYTIATTFYLNMEAYLSGQERLPFQERVLPILFIKPLTQSVWVMRHMSHSKGAFTPERGPFYLLSLVSLTVASIYTQRLYELLTRRGLMRYLVFPVFLFTVIWTYCIHSEANFSYPYDLSSLAFFTAGLFYIYRRRFMGLFVVVLIGTFNRETTLFLIALYLLDSTTPADAAVPWRFDRRLIPWSRATLLLVVWTAIKFTLAHHFRGNDHSEDFLRIRDNLQQLRPRLLPALLNICGYTLPLVLLFRRYLVPARFHNYLAVIPLWFAVMFCAGVIVETRIFGELCSFSAIAAVLIMERAAELDTSESSRPAKQSSQLDSERMLAPLPGNVTPSPAIR